MATIYWTPGGRTRMFIDVSPRSYAAVRFLRSSVGKKIVMAATGLALLAFVVAHMLGNLKIFAGAAAFDGYSRWLREIGSPVLGDGGLLWLVRVGLIACVGLHVVLAVHLTRRARAARGSVPAHAAVSRAGIAARSMRWGGVVIALFVAFHLLDLTAGVLNPHGVPGEVHRNVVASLRRPAVGLGYCVAVIAVGLHLRHGIWSALQTLGVRVEPVYQRVALVGAVALTLGFVCVPVAVLAGWVG